MSSRRLEDLQPHVADAVREWLRECESSGLDILVYCTYRSPEEQDELYASGRTKPGRIVTNARGGESWHNYGRAVDWVPMIGGKPLWKTTGTEWDVWESAGRIAEILGFEWAGRWTGKLRETAHIQMRDGLSIAQARAEWLRRR